MIENAHCIDYFQHGALQRKATKKWLAFEFWADWYNKELAHATSSTSRVNDEPRPNSGWDSQQESHRLSRSACTDG
jgi:hypothetical protein|tara:strand:+ start:339 stop:566 length:228 start_codon:yes stop_codon:yes gene_type:complete